MTPPTVRFPSAAQSLRRLWVGFGLAVATLAGVAQGGAASAPGTDRQDYSAAERLLFMTQHLKNVRPPVTLRYRLQRSGTLEPALDEKVSIALTARADGACCAAHTDFPSTAASSAQRLELPDLPAADGNPVLLYFLEREVREMNRLTKGSQSHFRKRLRMAAYQGATVKTLTLPFRGQPVAVREVSFSPYLDDPNRPRYEKLALKRYRFLLSDAVPGGVYGIHAQVPGADDKAAAALTETLYLDGATPAP